MLHDPGDLLDRPSIGINTGSNPQRDTIELAEFKYAISLRADEVTRRLHMGWRQGSPAAAA